MTGRGGKRGGNHGRSTELVRCDQEAHATAGHQRDVSKDFELEGVYESVVHSSYREGSECPAQFSSLVSGGGRDSVGKVGD